MVYIGLEIGVIWDVNMHVTAGTYETASLSLALFPDLNVFAHFGIVSFKFVFFPFGVKLFLYAMAYKILLTFQ